MKILVACEESGRVTKAFREKGHEAFSVDLKPTTGELSQYHIIGNVLDYLNDNLLPKPFMTFQLYEFGAFYSKKTCLWLKNLPYLMPTHYVDKTDIKPLITVHNSFELYQTIESQSTFRSKTFNGVALAMADQWG